MDSFLHPDLKFDFPAVTGKRVLVQGTGGGSDCLAAFAVANLLRQSKPAALLYGNTKREGADFTPLEIAGALTQHLGTAPHEPDAAAQHGTSSIDSWLPRGDEGSPLILELRKDHSSKCKVVEELRSLNLDFVLTVDIGGDSMLRSGRDRDLLELVRQLEVEHLHVIVGLGADAECQENELRDAIERKMKDKMYLGWFDLEVLKESLEKYAKRLAPDRTPKIILDAMGKNRSEDKVWIHRHNDRALIPTHWLRAGIAFRGVPYAN